LNNPDLLEGVVPAQNEAARGAPDRAEDLARGAGGHAVRGKARDEVLDFVARFLYRQGVRPNHLTLAQVPVYALMIHAGYHQRLWAFAILQAVVILLDGLDGTVARRMGVQSRKGAYLDAAFDLFGIVLVMVVAIWVFPEYSLILVALLVGNLLLYFQNWLLDEKAVSFVRGPIVLGLIAERQWPGVFAWAVLVPLAVTVLIIVVRMVVRPRRDLEGPPAVFRGPPPYRPGFKAEEDRRE
jgi:phosphatidylglycerophosphate synthase